MAVWKDKFIDVNGYARSGKKLKGVRKIVMHYTANNGASAENHYRYFNNLRDRYASAHFFVDKDEVICIIPLNEVAYHAGDVQQRNANGTPYRGVKELLPSANELSIGIEMCLEKDGSFHPDMLKRAKAVAVELCKRYKLDPMEDIVRHYDVTHKNCPAPWVKDSSKFEAFKKDVNALLHPKKDVEDEKPVVKPIKKPVKKPVKKPATKGLVYSKVLSKGSKGEDVKALQKALNKLKFNCGTPDGSYGEKTKDAVMRFQKVYLPHDVDGIAGKQTIEKINSLLD
jgi:N-acetylmuramoyl-L-alanine amidase